MSFIDVIAKERDGSQVEADAIGQDIVQAVARAHARFGHHDKDLTFQQWWPGGAER